MAGELLSLSSGSASSLCCFFVVLGTVAQGWGWKRSRVGLVQLPGLGLLGPGLVMAGGSFYTEFLAQQKASEGTHASTAGCSWGKGVLCHEGLPTACYLGSLGDSPHPGDLGQPPSQKPHSPSHSSQHGKKLVQPHSAISGWNCQVTRVGDR